VRDVTSTSTSTLYFWSILVPYGVVNILHINIEYILALKLFAGRPKDREDIASLCQLLQIRTRAQAQQLVDRYIPNKQVQQLNHLDDTLDAWFP